MMKTMPRNPSFLRPLVLAGLLAGASFSDVTAAELRYQFKTGSNYLYSVRIEASEPEFTETVSGSATYAVKSANADGITFTMRSSLHTQRKSKSGSVVPGISGGPPSFRAGGFRLGEFGRPNSTFARANEVQIDSTGQVLQETGRSQLPQALGDLSRVATELLPASGKSTWESTSDCVIVLEEKEFTPPGSRFYRIKDVRLPAKEKITFTLGAITGDLVPVARKYELKTAQSVLGQPRMSITGEGTNTFDSKRGVMRDVAFKGTLTENTPNTTLRVPITLALKLLEGAELAAHQKAVLAGPPKPELNVLPDAELKTSITDLGGNNKSRRTVALSRLSNSKPDDARKAEVTAQLLAVLKDEDPLARQFAAKALGNWGTTDAVKPLIAALDDKQFGPRMTAIESLGTLKDSRGIDALARMVAQRKDHFLAGNALKAGGDAAEEATLKLLKDTNAEVRREACQILKAVGSKKSVAALENASRDTDNLVVLYAKQALEEVRQR